MLDKIIEIGPKLESLNLSKDQFIIESNKLLEKISINLNLNEFSSQLSEWMLNSTMPEQLNVYNAFGQPPVTLFNNKEFVVDLYFWMHADTSIHSHAFYGSFKVLYGKSIHETFSIDPVNTYSRDVALNDIKRDSTKVLNAGDCIKINSGSGFNHRVVHLSRPTVTLCIRSISDYKMDQWHYFDNGLSVLKKELDQTTLKKLFYCDYLFEIDQLQSEGFMVNFIEQLLPSELLNLFEQLSSDTMGLSDESQQLVYEIMINKLNSFEWYDLYEQACEKAQLAQTMLASSEKDKLIAHANFYQYSEELKIQLLSAFVNN